MVLSNIDERLSNVDEPKMFTVKEIIGLLLVASVCLHVRLSVRLSALSRLICFGLVELAD